MLEAQTLTIRQPNLKSRCAQYNKILPQSQTQKNLPMLTMKQWTEVELLEKLNIMSSLEKHFPSFLEWPRTRKLAWTFKRLQVDKGSPLPPREIFILLVVTTVSKYVSNVSQHIGCIYRPIIIIFLIIIITQNKENIVYQSYNPSPSPPPLGIWHCDYNAWGA